MEAVGYVRQLRAEIHVASSVSGGCIKGERKMARGFVSRAETSVGALQWPPHQSRRHIEAAAVLKRCKLLPVWSITKCFCTQSIERE
jgi:hypothetical protein